MKTKTRYLWEFLAEEGIDDVRGRLRGLFPEPYLGELFAWLGRVVVKPSRATRRFGSVGVPLDGSGRPAVMRITTLPMAPENRGDTIRHELAHLVAYWTTKAPPAHDATWKAFAKALGAKPKATANDPLFAEAAQEIRDERLRIVARCARCDYEVLRTRATKKFRRPIYVHRGCGGLLVAVD